MKLATFYKFRWLSVIFLLLICVLYTFGFKFTALGLLIVSASIGAILGVIVQFHSLPGKCDLCSRKARLIAKYQDGFGNRIMLKCENCGLVINSSSYGVKIERYTDCILENEDHQ
jgi:hypothetical protein